MKLATAGAFATVLGALPLSLKAEKWIKHHFDEEIAADHKQAKKSLHMAYDAAVASGNPVSVAAVAAVKEAMNQVNHDEWELSHDLNKRNYREYWRDYVKLEKNTDKALKAIDEAKGAVVDSPKVVEHLNRAEQFLGDENHIIHQGVHYDGDNVYETGTYEGGEEGYSAS